MPAQNETRLVTYHKWTLRVRPSTLESARLLLLIHGLTGDENSMWVFVGNFPADRWIVAPRAPHSTHPSGYSWSAMRRRARGRLTLEDLQPPADALMTLVDEYTAEHGIGAGEFDLMGFSQGAALANIIALLYPARVRRVGVLAGFVPAGCKELLEKRPLAGKPFFVAHGKSDPMVEIEQARQSVRRLEQAGARVTFCEDEVGHKLGAGCLRALKTFFA